MSESVTLQSMFERYIAGLCFGAGLITSAVLFKLAFGVSFC